MLQEMKLEIVDRLLVRSIWDSRVKDWEFLRFESSSGDSICIRYSLINRRKAPNPNSTQVNCGSHNQAKGKDMPTKRIKEREAEDRKKTKLSTTIKVQLA